MEKVLVVDNQISFCNLLEKFLSKNGYQVNTCTQALLALGLLKQADYKFIICDYWLPGINGYDFFCEIKKIAPQASVVFTSSSINLKNVVEIIRKGAFYYLAKPINPDELLSILNENIQDRSEKNYQKSEKRTGPNPEKQENMPEYVYGISKVAREVQFKVDKVGPTNYSVIIEGETGTGKEFYARLIHLSSKRKNRPFIAVDCGSLSKEIGRSELFGHEKGAFTGAVTSKVGFFELAEGGTIFLDEITNLSSEIQMILLRALQEKVMRKVGGTKEIPFDVRIIAATNENLFSNTEHSGFREDLFYRLSEFVLQVPPLRERGDDIYLLIDFFLRKTADELGMATIPNFTSAAMVQLESHTWPGNIRELKNAIRRACLFINENEEIDEIALPERIKTHIENPYIAFMEISNNMDGDGQNGTVKDLKSTALMAESKKIWEVLRDVKFNKTKAAEKLNIHRKTLYSKLKALNISC